ncbi:hypothetical protein BDW75DRAFT_244588 [Aspergillus navahoensis]
MIPEGLQYASISSTLSKIKTIGMNVIRLTFPTQLVDDIYERDSNTTVLESLITALEPRMERGYSTRQQRTSRPSQTPPPGWKPTTRSPGLNTDTTLSPIPTGENQGSGTTFNLDDFRYANKLVLELHTYDRTTTSCANLLGALWYGGFQALDTNGSSIVNMMPVVLTEFGFAQDETPCRVFMLPA